MQRVVILQGNRTLAQLVAELLDALDCTAEIAASEMAAVRLLDAAPPDALVLDPGWSPSRGATVLAAWRANDTLSARPAVVISGREETDRLAERYGAACLRMPFGLPELLAPLRQLALVP